MAKEFKIVPIYNEETKSLFVGNVFGFHTSPKESIYPNGYVQTGFLAVNAGITNLFRLCVPETIILKGMDRLMVEKTTITSLLIEYIDDDSKIQTGVVKLDQPIDYEETVYGHVRVSGTLEVNDEETLKTVDGKPLPLPKGGLNVPFSSTIANTHWRMDIAGKPSAEGSKAKLLGIALETYYETNDKNVFISDS